MNHRWLWIVFGLALYVGLGCDEECDTMQVSLVSEGSNPTDLGPPLVLEHGLDSNVVRLGDVLHVWVVFSDPDGTDDVVGALLFDADTHFVYEGAERFDTGVLHFEIPRETMDLMPATGEIRNLQVTLWDRAGGFANSDVMRVTLIN